MNDRIWLAAEALANWVADHDGDEQDPADWYDAAAAAVYAWWGGRAA